MSLSILIPQTESTLTAAYYDKTCPELKSIVANIISTKQIEDPTTAAATLRLFFHDCMVEGCDASLLISSNSFNIAERDADINIPLSGDSFDVITRAKTAIEIQCPNTVSCADILAIATRDLIVMVGGPFYEVRLGRKDGLISQASRVAGNLATSSMSVSEMISMFAAKGLTKKDLVALSGAHTIGFSHCNEFIDRLYNFSKTSDIDPTYNRRYAEALRKLCANYTTDIGMAAFNDVVTPGKFDNMYFMNLQRGLGLLSTDQALYADTRTKPLVDLYAQNQTAFFQDFADAMERVSVYNIKMGSKGEIRRRCDSFNHVRTSWKSTKRKKIADHNILRVHHNEWPN